PNAGAYLSEIIPASDQHRPDALVQMTRLASTAMALPTVSTTRTTRRLAKLQRIHQIIKTLAEQLVDFGHHTTQLGAIKMTLHHVDDVLHQQVTLHLHDRRRVGADKEHDKIIARLRVR